MKSHNIGALGTAMVAPPLTPGVRAACGGAHSELLRK